MECVIDLRGPGGTIGIVHTRTVLCLGARLCIRYLPKYCKFGIYTVPIRDVSYCVGDTRLLSITGFYGIIVQ